MWSQLAQKASRVGRHLSFPTSSGSSSSARKKKSEAEGSAPEEAKSKPPDQAATLTLVLLGAGGSGKTTIRKQFENLYNHAYDDPNVRRGYRDTIVRNLCEGLVATAAAARDPDVGRGLRSLEAEQACDLFESLDLNRLRLDDRLARAVRVAALDAGFMSAIAQRSKFQLQENFLPFFNACVAAYPEWGGPNWTPTVDECVRSRVRSSGVTEVQFSIDNQKFKVYDAGGQRSERRKWALAFPELAALLFVASMTDYDEVLFEDSSKNRLLESLEVFEEIALAYPFRHTPILLFLNKYDLFLEKYQIRKIPLNASGLFPDAPRGEHVVQDIVDWMALRYIAKRTKFDPSLIFIHTTSAVDPLQIDHVFRDVKEIVLLRLMSQQGLI